MPRSAATGLQYGAVRSLVNKLRYRGHASCRILFRIGTLDGIYDAEHCFCC